MAVKVPGATYEHDCTDCVFLGRFAEHDLYWCSQGGFMPTIIARYGDDGPEYASTGYGLPLGGAVIYAEPDGYRVSWPDAPPHDWPGPDWLAPQRHRF